VNYKKRKDIVDCFVRAENSLPVSKWEYQSIKLWPLIKICIFWTQYGGNEQISQKKTSLKSAIITLLSALKADVIISFFAYKTTRIPKTDILFSGYSGHRTVWREQFFNRYFDPIMDSLYDEMGLETLLCEYETKEDIEYYKEQRVVEVNGFRKYFRFLSSKPQLELQNLEGYDDFIADLLSVITIEEKTLVKKIIDQIEEVLCWKLLWNKVLQEAKPKMVFVLCYYNIKMSGLILAARELGIQTVDMQHGGQGDLHVAYNYENIPEEGFNMLPHYFWVWDNHSEQNLVKNISGTGHHAVLGGNPWITFLQNQDFNVELGSRKIIIYTLQTIFNQILPDYIIDAVKNTPSNFCWWLRLHPRASEKQKDDLKDLLSQHGLLDAIKIDDSKEIPLPAILAKATVHLSHFSGSVIEASLMNVPLNVVVGDEGKQFFFDLIQKDEAVYYDPATDCPLHVFLKDKLSQRLDAVENRQDKLVSLKSFIENTLC